MRSNLEKLLCGPIDSTIVFDREGREFVQRIKKHLKLSTLGELVQLTEEKLLSLQVFSIHILHEPSLEKIKECLSFQGLSLGMVLDRKLRILIASTVRKPKRAKKPNNKRGVQ